MYGIRLTDLIKMDYNLDLDKSVFIYLSIYYRNIYISTYTIED